MDIERTMQFILEQQARLEASAGKHDAMMAELQALAAKHDERIAKNEEQIATLTDLVGRLAQAEIRLVERMEKLGAQTQGHETRLESLETKATRLFERMDRFIQGLEGDGHKPR